MPMVENIKRIEEIMNNFNFELVHKVMSLEIFPEYDEYGNIERYDSWKTVLPNGGYGVPTVTELRNLAWKMLYQTVNVHSEIHEGPFITLYDEDELTLIFACESWSSY